MAGGGKHNIHYIKQDLPKFLKDFKSRAGVKDGPTIESKRKIPEREVGDDGSDNEREDEKPTVCVLREGDLTSVEAAVVEERLKEEEGSKAISDGNIVFKKPKVNDNAAACDAPQSHLQKKQTRKRKEHPRSGNSKKVKNASLLSFDSNDVDE